MTGFLGGTIFLIIAAIIPAVVLLFLVYIADRAEKEPIRLLISLLLFGVLSALPAILTELVGTAVLGAIWDEESFIYIFLMNFIVIALSEEGFKYLFLRIRSWKHPAFNCLFDGIVYSVFVSLGFALFENIFYVLQNGLGVAIVRALISVPGHACFGIFMCVWYSFAKKYANKGQKSRSTLFRILAVAIPTIMHGFFDFALSCENVFSIIFFLVFVLVMFFVSFRLIKYISSSDEAI